MFRRVLFQVRWFIGITAGIVLAIVGLNPPHSRAINRIVFDVAAGEVIEHERYQDKPAGDKIMSSMFSPYSGRFFGLPGAVLMMSASFLMPPSAVSGWLLYLDRRRTRKSNLASGCSHGDVRRGK